MAGQSRRAAVGTPSDLSLRGESRRSDGKATTLRSCRADLAIFGAVMCLGRPCVVGAVQVAPTPRIRPREVPRHGGSEAHGASKSRPSNLKLAQAGVGRVLVWACCARRKFSPHLAYSDGKRASGCSHVTPSTGRPLPAYSRRLASLQAARSLCHAYGMHASSRQQQACF